MKLGQNVEETTPRRTCLTCGSHVTPRFVRVMGDNDGTVDACPRCHGPRDRDDADSETR